MILLLVRPGTKINISLPYLNEREGRKKVISVKRKKKIRIDLEWLSFT